jgi:tetrahydromethanopterin S-methyltransferase subunit G
MEAAAMTNAQMYFAIAVPTFAIIIGMAMNIMVLVWQARGIDRRIDGLEKRIDGIETRFEKRIDGIEARFDKLDRTLEVIQGDLKQFYTDIARLKERTGL